MRLPSTPTLQSVAAYSCCTVKSLHQCAHSLQCHLSSTIVNEIPESAQLAGPILPIRSIAMRRLPVGLQLGTLCGMRRYGWVWLG